jgi:hypothetical protein
MQGNKRHSNSKYFTNFFALIHLLLKRQDKISGDKINVLASFNDFYFISEKDNEVGWILKKLL